MRNPWRFARAALVAVLALLIAGAAILATAQQLGQDLWVPYVYKVRFGMPGEANTPVLGRGAASRLDLDGGVLRLNVGVNNDGGGAKHSRSQTGCATAATAGSTCDTTVTWTTAFADANYTPVCAGLGITSGVPADGGVVSKAAGSVVFRTVAITAAAAQYTNVSCLGLHD